MFHTNPNIAKHNKFNYLFFFLCLFLKILLFIYFLIFLFYLFIYFLIYFLKVFGVFIVKWLCWNVFSYMFGYEFWSIILFWECDYGYFFFEATVDVLL